VAATLAGSGPLVAAGLTDPREWGAVGWLSDIVPHAAYGAAAAATLRALRCGAARRAGLA